MSTDESKIEQFPAPAKKIGVMIATPMRSYSGIQDLPKSVGRTLRELIGRQDAVGYSWEFAAAVGGLCRARNSLVHEFLKTDMTWLLWWDSDLELTGDIVLRLISHRQPIVGALYCKRAKKPQWVATFMPAAELQPDADGLLQVAELGGGAKLYHRKVFTEIARIFPTLTYRERETGEKIAGFYQNLVLDSDLLSEDYYLDYLCRCAKLGILVDTKIQVKHRDADGTLYPVGDFPPLPVA